MLSKKTRIHSEDVIYLLNVLAVIIIKHLTIFRTMIDLLTEYPEKQEECLEKAKVQIEECAKLTRVLQGIEQKVLFQLLKAIDSSKSPFENEERVNEILGRGRDQTSVQIINESL